MPVLHHVNLGVLPDGLDDEVAWLEQMLGFRRIDAGPELTALGACWLEADDGRQIHLSRDPSHQPAKQAHVAVTFDALGPVCRRLDESEQAYDRSERAGIQVVLCTDPAGNKWELREPAAS
jgi:hypothetical protein